MRASVIRAISARNHGSMRVASASVSISIPRRSRASSWKMRSGLPTATSASSRSVDNWSRAASAASALRPSRPTSSERTAFCSDSGKVRPMAMTSPTDCMRVPSSGTAPGSFSKAQRGTLVTT